GELGVVQQIDERLMTAGTALASCGLAYAFRYIRAATEGGVELGFYPEQAKDIVLQTLKGAVALLEANGTHAEVEIDKVCTPGGITIRGLNEMEHAGFTSAVVRGLKVSGK
ncbi:MAG: pyrroline-5-carboxylate reductase, partial [Tannerella sp.]|nr:pyrroline-5-carboxylate reductase [Tannerella sp.]